MDIPYEALPSVRAFIGFETALLFATTTHNVNLCQNSTKSISSKVSVG